jgi:protein-disulfide isomerase
MTISREYKILGGLIIGALVLGWLLFYLTGNSSNTNQTKTLLVDRPSAYYKGNKDAKVTITEFADFQCPACRLAQPTVNKLLADYPNNIKFVFRHFPLPNHPLAQISAEAAEAAGAQGNFWEMHDLLYYRQIEWGDLSKNLTEAQAKDLFKTYAQSLSLDTTKFTNDLNNSAYKSLIDQDYNQGIASGVDATPKFFVNNKVIATPNYDDIKKAIDAALGK